MMDERVREALNIVSAARKRRLMIDDLKDSLPMLPPDDAVKVREALDILEQGAA